MYGTSMVTRNWIFPNVWCSDAENLEVKILSLCRKNLIIIFLFVYERISVIFRVRSAKAVKITDAFLLKRLGILCGFVGIALLVRTLVAPPVVIVGKTADNLKAFLCKTDWWDHTFTSR